MALNKPTMRVKRRYMLIQASTSEIEKALLHALGTIGVAKAAPLFVTDKKMPSGSSILAIERAAVDSVRAACELALPPLRVLRVSGTLKGLLG